MSLSPVHLEQSRAGAGVAWCFGSCSAADRAARERGRVGTERAGVLLPQNIRKYAQIFWMNPKYESKISSNMAKVWQNMHSLGIFWAYFVDKPFASGCAHLERALPWSERRQTQRPSGFCSARRPCARRRMRPPVNNDIAGILRRMQPRCQRYRGSLRSGT